MTAVIGYGNLLDSSTVSDPFGNFAAAYPVSNIKNKSLGVFARTTGTTAAIKVDLGTAKLIDVVGAVTSPGSIIAGSGSMYVAFSNDDFASGTNVVSQNQLAYGSGPGMFFVLNTPIVARWWRFDFSVPSGTIDIGRIFIGNEFKPYYGLSFGASSGFESRTTRQESASGRRFHRNRTPRRVLNGVFEYLTDDEGHLWQQIQQSHDIAEEHVLIWDDQDASNKRGMRNFLCNADELGPMEFPYATERKIGVKFSEIIA